MELCSYTNTNVNATTNKSNEQIEEKKYKIFTQNKYYRQTERETVIQFKWNEWALNKDDTKWSLHNSYKRTHTDGEQDTAAQKPSVCGTRSFDSVSLLYFIYLSRNLSMANTRIHRQCLAFSLNLEARCCFNFRMRWHCDCMGARVWFFLAINHSPFVLFVQCVYVRTAYVCLLDLYGFVHTYSGNTQQKLSLFHTLTTISFRRYVCVCVLCFVYAQPLMHANCTPNTLLRTRSKSLYEHI